MPLEGKIGSEERKCEEKRIIKCLLYIPSEEESAITFTQCRERGNSFHLISSLQPQFQSPRDVIILGWGKDTGPVVVVVAVLSRWKMWVQTEEEEKGGLCLRHKHSLEEGEKRKGFVVAQTRSGREKGVCSPSNSACLVGCVQ